MPTLNSFITNEISRIADIYSIDPKLLEQFATFVVENHKKKEPAKKAPKVAKPKPLTLPQLKEAIYSHFKVRTTDQLKKSDSFKMATDGLGKINLSNKSGWEILYRTQIGILPGEDGETGYGCINGIDIFKYAMPWRVFGLDSQTASTEDVKQSYRELSMIHHPDKGGDAAIFDRLTVFYKSLVAEA